MRMLSGYQLSQAISVGVRLGVPDLLKDGARSSDELARRTEAHPPSLYRLLRTLAAAGLLTESSDRRFALTPLGALLRRDTPDSLHAMASFVSIKESWERWGDMLQRVRSGEPVSGNIFLERGKASPEWAAAFNNYMTELAARRAAAVLGGYDFAGIATVVDVGGGHGRLLASILKAYPTMRGILFDLPHVIEGAKGLLDAAGVADRCERIGGDFFETVPRGGDAYLLSVVIHDWDDERALIILKNCRTAMGTSGRLLLIERVVSTDGEQSLHVMLSDLNMLVGPGGRERTAEEFSALLSTAGFRLKRIVPLEFSYNVVEGVPV
ncbi:MAG: methyltransferase [Armatimonadota bacterium]